MTHHPHVHVIVPGGGLSPDGTRWISSRSGFFLPVKVLSRLFLRLFLEGLSRYTHRVAISNHRLVSADAGAVAFRWKDYRIKRRDRTRTMRLPTHEFIRRFLIHVLPSGFHRIRHTGFLAKGIRRDRIKMVRRLLDAEPEPGQTPGEGESDDAADLYVHQPCPKCGGAMIVIETFLRGQAPKSRALPREEAA